MPAPAPESLVAMLMTRFKGPPLALWWELLGGPLQSAPVHLAEVVHRAELGAAHRAELGGLEVVVRQGLVVHLLGGLRVEGELELPPPVEGVARSRELVVPVAGTGSSARDVRRVRGDAVGDEPLLHFFGVREAQMLLGGHVAEHAGAVPTYNGGAYGARDVIIAGGDICYQGAKGVEGGLVADLLLHLHVLLELVEGYMAGTLYHDLHVLLPGTLGELAQGPKLGELGLIRGVGHAPRTEAVSQGDGDVVAATDLEYLVEALVQRVLLYVVDHPPGQEPPAAGDDPGYAAL